MKIKNIKTVCCCLLILSAVLLYAFIFTTSVKAQGTKFIKDNANGGDCYLIGNWDVSTKTCTLTQDFYETIQIDNHYVTLDGNGYALVGSGVSESIGVYVPGRMSVIIKNLKIRKFTYGIYLNGSTDNILTNNTVLDSPRGIYLYSSSRNTVSGNNFFTNNQGGISLLFSNNNIIANNRSTNSIGISLNNSNSNTLINNISSNDALGIIIGYSNSNNLNGNISDLNTYYGIQIYFSNNNILTNNIAQNNYYGISLSSSGGNSLTNNIMKNNKYNFEVYGDLDAHFLNNIDTTNIVDGKLIYYINGANNQIYSSSTNAGILYCIECKNVIISNLEFTGNTYGLFLRKTQDSIIENIKSNGNQIGMILSSSTGNHIINSYIKFNSVIGISLLNSHFNFLERNSIDSNQTGILITASNENKINKNNIFNSLGGGSGMILQSSYNNIINENTFFNNYYGLTVNVASGQVYRNNFIDNMFDLNNPASASSSLLFNLFKSIGGNYWSRYHSSQQGCNDRDLDGFCDIPYFIYPAFSSTIFGIDNFPWVMQNGWGNPPLISLPFWSQIKNFDGKLNLRQTPGVQNKSVDDIIKTFPNDWAVKVVSTTDESGNNIDIDNYRWYKVEDVSDGTIGWMAAVSLADGVVYLRYDQNAQTDLEKKAAEQLDTADKRKPHLLQAVDKYYFNTDISNSLYGIIGGRDGLNNFQKFIAGAIFPEELILSIAAEESGGPFEFNNEICSSAKDGGIGIMQITSPDFKGKGSGLDNNQKRNDCNKNFDWVGDFSKYYSNTIQGIYANVKDGFRVLQEKYRSQCFEEQSGNLYFTCFDIRRILTIWGYNGFGDKSGGYLNKIAQKLESLSNDFPGVVYSNTDQFIQKLRQADRNKILALLGSPGELQVKDLNGNITGVTESQIKEDIPNSLYEPDYKGVAVFFPKNPYIYKVVGTDSGTYDLDVDFTDNGVLKTFRAIDIPITLNEIHEYLIDWNALDKGERGVAVRIDSDGNGIMDRIVQSDGVLTEIEPPAISIISPAGEYLFNSQAQIQFTAVDALSGITTIVAKLNENLVVNGQFIFLTQPGTNTLEVIVMDNEGNTAIATSTFQVLYATNGFLSPIKSDGTGIYNQGRTLPVKFELFDVNGNSVSQVIARFYAAKISNNIAGTDEIPLSIVAADAGNQFRYDSAWRLYIFNLSTNTMSQGAWQIKAVLEGGQVITGIISIK